MSSPSYYKSEEWFAFRRRAIDNVRGLCEHCNRSKADGAIFQIHHPNYVKGKKPWEYELFEIEVLCKGCHAKEHGKIQPTTDWDFVGEDDLGDPSGECDNCGREIRYVCFILHPKWNSMTVGTGCCDYLCESKIASTYQQKNSRRNRFLAKSNWSKKSNCVECTKFNGHKVELKTVESKFYFVIDSIEGKLRFKSPQDAKRELFKLVEMGKLKAFFAKRK
jgi:hypothetical protein